MVGKYTRHSLHQKGRTNLTKRSFSKGFSLAELLVVIFLITIFLGIGGLSITKNNNSQGLNTALATVDSLVFEARDLAIKSGFNTRLVFNNTAGPGFLSHIVIAKQDAAGLYTATSKLVKLPKGIYLDTTKSVPSVPLGGLAAGLAVTYGSAPFPGNVAVEFNPQGICIDSTLAGANPGAHIVLVKYPNPNALPSTGSDQDAALVIWRNGSTTKVMDSALVL